MRTDHRRALLRGTSGLSIGRISPEAAAGGTIGLVHAGDEILVAGAERRSEVLVDEERPAERRARMESSEHPWQPNAREREMSTALRAYASLATSASFGAVRALGS